MHDCTCTCGRLSPPRGRAGGKVRARKTRDWRGQRLPLALCTLLSLFFFCFFKHCENTSRQAQTTYFHCVLCLWAKRASTTVRARFQAYVHTREKESQRTGLPGCRAPRTVAWSVCRAAARGQLAGARRTQSSRLHSRLSRRHWDSSRGRLGPAGIETHETRWARFC